MRKKRTDFQPRPQKFSEGQQGKFYERAVQKVHGRINVRQKKG